jgi:hypothetical protein
LTYLSEIDKPLYKDLLIGTFKKMFDIRASKINIFQVSESSEKLYINLIFLKHCGSSLRI